MMVWRHVQRALSSMTRVCAYDRAGYGFSDPPGAASNARVIVADLQRLIPAAAFRPPIIYVGHSAAGLYGPLLASRAPKLVAGLVLIDPAFPEATRVTEAPLSAASRRALRGYYHETLAFLDRCHQLAESGALRHPTTSAARACLDTRGYRDRLSPTLRTALSRQYAEAKLWRAARAEYASLWPDSTGRVLNDQIVADQRLDLGAIPLAVLLRDGSHDPTPPGRSDTEQQAVEAARQRGVRELAERSRRGRVELVRGTSHHIQFDQPQRVIDAIQKMIAVVRNASRP
jgi:pimeloyl-ACP methyl ester carboxylesterase